jgi:periplasmic protein TonB
MSVPAVTNTPAKRPMGAATHDFMPALFGLEYSTYGTKPTNFVLSFVLHTLLALALLISTSFLVSHRNEIKATVSGVVTDISPYILPPAKDQAGGGGGGGDRDKLAATKGAPPKFARDQFTPPAIVIRNPDPKLPMDPTVVGPPDLKLPTGPPGDPMSNILGPPSNGTGSGGGIGTGSGGGVGSGRGPGVGPGWGGGIGGGPYRVGGGVSAPRVVYQPDPEYSEEARKAKYQGTVVLWVVVGPDGRPHDIRVQRTLGMGLDEKAIEAVRTWKFEPARKDGQPVAVQINIEVNFRLY